MYEVYKAAAETLGLRMNPPVPGLLTLSIDLDGVVDEQHVHVRRVTGSGAVVVVRSSWLTPLGAGLSVRRVGMVDTLLALAGMHDLQVGDDIFDDAFRVKAHDAERARRILREEVRNALLRLHGRATLDDERVETSFDHGEEGLELLTQTCHGVALVAALVQVAAPRSPYRDAR